MHSITFLICPLESILQSYIYYALLIAISLVSIGIYLLTCTFLSVFCTFSTPSITLPFYCLGILLRFFQLPFIKTRWIMIRFRLMSLYYHSLLYLSILFCVFLLILFQLIYFLYYYLLIMCQCIKLFIQFILFLQLQQFVTKTFRYL